MPVSWASRNPNRGGSGGRIKARGRVGALHGRAERERGRWRRGHSCLRREQCVRGFPGRGEDLVALLLRNAWMSGTLPAINCLAISVRPSAFAAVAIARVIDGSISQGSGTGLIGKTSRCRPPSTPLRCVDPAPVGGRHAERREAASKLCAFFITT